MAINVPGPKRNSKTEENITPSVSELEHNINDFETAVDASNAPQQLVKASQDAQLAKTAVRKAISQAFKEREESVKKAQTLAQAFDEAIQSNIAPDNRLSSKDIEPAVAGNSAESTTGMPVKKLTASSNTQSAFADIIKAYFGNKLEIKKDVNHPATGQNQNIRQVIEHISEDQAQKKAARIMGDAKSDRIASKLAVNQAQEEIRKAREEAEMIKRTAEEAVSRAHEEAALTRQEAEDAIAATKEWIEQAKDEVMAEKKPPV